MTDRHDTAQGRVDLDPETLRSAAERLDALASRVEAALDRIAPVSAPTPAGADEVSQAAATALGEQTGILHDRLADATSGIRADATDLRRHAEAYESTDRANADRFREVRR